MKQFFVGCHWKFRHCGYFSNEWLTRELESGAVEFFLSLAVWLLKLLNLSDSGVLEASLKREIICPNSEFSNVYMRTWNFPSWSKLSDGKSRCNMSDCFCHCYYYYHMLCYNTTFCKTCHFQRVIGKVKLI